MTGWGVPAFFVFAGTPLVVANSDAHYCATKNCEDTESKNRRHQ
jgi:hypothetical protein